MKTRTIAYVAPKKIEVREVNVEDPGEGQLQVRKVACGICAWDLSTYKIGPEDNPYAAPPGHEGLGRVVKVGKEVTGYKEGDWVAGGGFQEVQNVPSKDAVRIPYAVENPLAWIVEPIACVVNGIERAQIFPGERVALIGTGYMGLLMVQGLAASLVGELIAIDTNEQRLAMARKFGAHRVMQIGKDDAAIEALVAERADVVVELAGAQPALDLSVRMVRNGGNLCIFSWHRGNRTIDCNALHTRGINVLNTAPKNAPNYPRVWKNMLPLVARGVFKNDELVSHTAPIDRYDQLLDTAMYPEKGYLKGVVRYDA
ncbi:MAG: zinc-binding dehydrogenase [Planctomycetota bacterium]|nr:zinc-binding dehydrogenase [Planctomycetota bacterium]